MEWKCRWSVVEIFNAVGLPLWQDGKAFTCNVEDLGSLGQEDTLEKGMAIQSSIVA